MASDINGDNLVQRLREAFPELEELYRQRTMEWKGRGQPSSYEVAGFVLRPYLQREVANRQVTDFVLRFASFCERVCTLGMRRLLM